MRRFNPHRGKTRRIRRDSGAMLLAVLFMMAIMVITALAVAPAIIQQAKRDREEEMIHRGTEYARAVKKYYKKFGRYPANVEQLENTNQMRFLRRKYKDPLAKDGQWRLLRYGDIQSLVGGAGFVVPGASGQPGQIQGLNGPSAGPGGTATTSGAFGASTAPAGAQLSAQQQSQFLNNAAGAGAALVGAAQTQLGGGTVGGTSSDTTATSSANQPQGAGGDAGQTSGQGATGQTGSNNTIFGNTGVGGQNFGGGAIVGVASKSKEPTIRIFNKKKTYDEWQFIYTPMLDFQNTLLRGPYNGQVAQAGQFGTPANQLNNGGAGRQLGAPAQQNQQNNQPNQPLTPGGQFPPDQTQTQ
jgi:type II secretory pathway pseudopilin PulG